MNRLRVITAGLMIALLTGSLVAGSGACHRCGCAGASKVCRWVKEEKSVTVVCWGVQEEDVCLPGPSCQVCEHVECVCDACDPEGKVHTGPKLFSWREWLPKKPAELVTKRKLMKKSVTKKIPSYKWVVEDLCGDCALHCQSAACGADCGR
jgi:hypothetical protein